jgi:hypothetical protein
MWIKSIVIITVSIIVLFGLVSLYGSYQWRLSTDKLRAKLFDSITKEKLQRLIMSCNLTAC